MNLIKNCLCVALASFALTPLISNAAQLSPHVGLDYKHWGTYAKEDNVFPDLSNGLNVYVGARFNQIWGLDVGYESSTTENQHHIYTGNTQIFGSVEPSGDSSNISNQLQSWYVLGSYYYRIVPCLDLMFNLGIANTMSNINVSYFQAGNPAAFSGSSENIWSARFGFGLIYLINEAFSLKASVLFDQTRLLQLNGTNSTGSSYLINPYNLSGSLYFGARFSFY